MNEPKPQQEPSMEEILASIRRIISEDGAPGESSDGRGGPAVAVAAAGSEDDVLELTNIVEDAPATAPDPEPEPEPEEEAAVEAEAEPEEAPEPEPAAPLPVAESELLSAAPATSATGALAALVAAADPLDRGGITLGEENRTFEDMVKEVMRPMIREWLDANLPKLVERLVRREIERIARRAEDS